MARDMIDEMAAHSEMVSNYVASLSAFGSTPYWPTHDAVTKLATTIRAEAENLMIKPRDPRKAVYEIALKAYEIVSAIAQHAVTEEAKTRIKAQDLPMKEAFAGRRPR